MYSRLFLCFRDTMYHKNCPNSLNKLKPSHSCGHDNISSNVLKIIAIEVSPCLTLIINQVLSTSQFPKNLKTA